ncbi:Dyp-type peroxidase domain-containing protein [Piscinibacter sp. HJYY11]|uniref:Dyp-type peroxidase domain-containing protein n=1 Tax=Piscinibacter sp. HJYY11 TaxID=2801333 RepID=UPI00191F026C|nr:Dyp-type peroxidase domain-containing protein [Piscinibacter sp. HJYY11]MBL0728982.1 Dyp-type peroxidase [Piscinibacter sp. HJYY11]
MRREIKPKTGQMLDTSDLTVAAPIRQGLVPSLDAVSYKTRAERVLQLLQLGRAGQQEFELTRVLADSVDRIGLIHSVRVGIIEPQNLLMLSVTFDGAWEPYMRVIWQKVARLLDLIFSNTEGYVYGWESSYEQWMTWLRRHQVHSPFFYSQSQMTAGDVDLLRRQEWLQRQKTGQEAPARLMSTLNADEVEHALSDGGQADPRFPGSQPYATPFGGNYLLVRQSVRALAALHRLTDVYLPGTHDGWVLHRAGCEALSRLAYLHRSGSVDLDDALERFADALDWLKRVESDPPPARKAPPLQAALTDVLPPAERKHVQAGILTPLEADHGGVLLMRFASSAELGAFLQKLPLTHHDQPFNGDGISVNVAFSVEGLRLAGFSDEELRAWPDAFFEGMPRRAGLLGDVRLNHPRNWRLPPRLTGGTFGATEQDDYAGTTHIELAEVHLLLQVRLKTGAVAVTPNDARTQLCAFLSKWTQPSQRLAVQWLHRQKSKAGHTTDHFGWRDAQTGPVFDATKASPRARDHSHVGEALCGYANAVDHRSPAASQPFARWLQNGSFLVVRKLRQDVAALDAAVGSVTPQLDADIVRAKLMGRWPEGATHGTPGEPLVRRPPPVGSNNFSFGGDPGGAICPLHAHIRRSNQRMAPGDLSNEEPVKGPQGPVRPPKLLRRGMSYGPSLVDDPAAERGLFFLAYNASLSEQFEVIQRWLSGSNASGGDSAQSDPLLGVAMPGQARTCLFHEAGQLHRVTLEAAVPLNEEPRPLVRLEWGSYFFAPALPIVAEMAVRAAGAGEMPLWRAHRGEEEIERLLSLERSAGPAVALQAWKEALEDPESLLDYRAQSIWAAIREFHGGQLKCAFGVLVATQAGVDHVLRQESLYTAVGYLGRMQYSFGPIFLGSDAGAADGRYERESAFIVEAIRKLPVDATYQRARDLTAARLQHLRDITVSAAQDAGDSKWRLTFDVRELLDDLLGHFCKDWFGILDGPAQPFAWGGLDVALGPHDKPRNPGHFASPSRYFFQPHPNADVARVGEAHGQALRRAMQALLDANPPGTANAPLVKAVRANPLHASDPTYAARTLVGVVMGFVPTVDGTLRRILAEWLREGSFWRLRGQCPALPDFKAASAFLMADFIRGIQMRAAPELLWRTAAADHTLGSGAHAISVKSGDRVVAGLLSATQANWERGSRDFHAVFGGDRKAAGAPTHACPGTDAAIALMLGFFAALLETKLALRPGPAGLSFEASDALERPPAVVDDSCTVEDGDGGAKKKFAQKVLVMTLGDSWLVKGVPLVFPTLSRALGSRGYEIEKDLASAQATSTAIAQSATAAVDELADVDLVLLDGGGNDVHQKPSFFRKPQNPDWDKLTDKKDRSTLDDLLEGKDGAVKLNDDAVKAFIDVHLKGVMRGALATLTSATSAKPVIIVGYDFPIPNGKVRVGKPWLKPAFTRVGLDATDAADLAKSTDLMKQLIERLNDMFADLVKEAAFAGKAFAVNLTGTLTQANEWIDELHPTAAGFEKLATVLDTAIRALPAPVPKPSP